MSSAIAYLLIFVDVFGNFLCFASRSEHASGQWFEPPIRSEIVLSYFFTFCLCSLFFLFISFFKCMCSYHFAINIDHLL